MEIHIGKLIKTKLDESDISVVRFAKAINTTRENAYGIFKRKSIDTELLLRISKVLNYNFFIDLSGQLKSITDDALLKTIDVNVMLENEFLKRENALLKDMIILLKEKLTK